MKKLIVILGFTALFNTTAFAKDSDTTQVARDDAKSERWYQSPKSSIEFYGVIDIGYTYTSN